MKAQKIIALLFLTFATLCLSCSLAVAGDKGDTRTVTGCLTKGSGDAFLLTGTDGSTWDVESTTVSLGDEVGHIIAATGVVSNAAMHNMKEGAKDMAADTGMKKNNHEHGSLKVTSVTKVSDNCK